MSPAPDSVSAGDLARLLETERRLADRLAAAKADAETLVGHARQAAAQREAALAAELEQEERSLADRLLQERRHREQQIVAAARKEIEAYESVSPRRLASIVRLLQGRLLDEGQAP